MPILRSRHEETTRSGEHLYVIVCPNEEFHGERWKVRFFKGIGKTKSRDKAQKFSEQLGYGVKLHKDEKPWKDAPDPLGRIAPVDIPEEEDSYFIDEEEDYE